MQLFTVLQRGLNFPPQEMFAYTRFQQEFQLFLCFLCGIVCLVKDTSAEGHNLQTEEEYIYIYIYCYIYIYILFYIYIYMYVPCGAKRMHVLQIIVTLFIFKIKELC